MCLSMTCVIDMSSILQMLRWKNTSNFLSSVSRSAQLSHPQNARLTEMAQKIMYLLWKSMTLSTQKCWRDPISDKARTSQCSMSKSSRR